MNTITEQTAAAQGAQTVGINLTTSTQETKSCNTCGVVKPLESFYKHRSKADGRENSCKVCKCRAVAERYAVVMSTPELHESKKLVENRRYHATMRNNPDKLKARAAVRSLPRTFQGSEFHHFSYRPEHYKEVLELTNAQHKLLHNFLVYDEESKMYRNLAGTLLDTLESHLDLLNVITDLN